MNIDTPPCINETHATQLAGDPVTVTYQRIDGAVYVLSAQWLGEDMDAAFFGRSISARWRREIEQTTGESL